MYPPTTDANRILEAIEALRDLRSRATSHHDTLNNWLIIDTLTDAITLLQAHDQDEEPEIDDEPPPDYGPPGTGAVIVEYD